MRELELTSGQQVAEVLDGATLTIMGAVIPCTHGPILGDFELMPGGPSPKTTVPSLEFRASLLSPQVPKKGVHCQLKITPTSDPIALQLWSGGLLSGGAVYQFMAVDANYRA